MSDAPASAQTGGDAIVRALESHGVDTVFGIPGAQVYGLFDALQRSGRIRVLGARHEQTCGYMAYGYARSTGRPGVFAVVPGPGILNASAALLTALGGNQPVLALTGQVPTAFLNRGRGHLHEMPDQLGTLRGVVKWADRIEHPSEAPAKVAQAFQAMQSGRPGPALLEMPWDVFTQTGSVRDYPPLPRLPLPVPDAAKVMFAAKLIGAAVNPMILVGGGAVHAQREVAGLADALHAPVVAFRSGRGILDDDCPLSLTLAAGARLWQQTDLIIGIGTRLELTGWRWQPRPGVKQIRIEIDAAEMRRSSPDVGILADAAKGTAALLASLPPSRPGVERRARVAAAKAEAATALEGLTPHAGFLRAIRDALPRDGILVDEMCQAGFASWFAFTLHAPRTLVTSGYQGTLGFGFPTALGVKAAHPSRAVVSLTGDGGIMFAIGDLATAVQYGLAVVVIVFNNNLFGNVRRDQQRMFAGRLIGSELRNPDFVALAASFGVDACRVADADALRAAVANALLHDRPWLIEVTIPPDTESSPWPFIQPAR